VSWGDTIGVDRFAGRAVDHDGACSGKVAHATAPKAWKIAKRMKRQGANVQPYRCKTCFYWHVGADREWSAARKRPARIRRRKSWTA